MPTNFKYVPLSPEPISGRAVLEQTERAINELGDAMEAGVDAATTLAQEAVDTANSANTTANSALIEAQDASTAAQSAQSTADTAFSIAQAAQSDASTALTTANQALDAAAIAEGDSSTALTTANQALTTANAAQETATTADQNASTSLTVSNNALAVSVVSMGIFTVLSDAIDANQYYVSAEKYFLTNSSCTNFPTDMTFPAWFMVYINSDGTSVTHTCWDDYCKNIYKNSNDK